MKYTTQLHNVTFNIEYSVDSEGDYDQFEILVGGETVNEVLDPKVIATLEQVTWDYGYIPDCKSWNDDLKVDRYLSSICPAGA